MDSGERVDASVELSGYKWSIYKNGPVSFERGYCFIKVPGENIFDLKPKRGLSQRFEKTLMLNSGFRNYGLMGRARL